MKTYHTKLSIFLLTIVMICDWLYVYDLSSHLSVTNHFARLIPFMLPLISVLTILSGIGIYYYRTDSFCLGIFLLILSMFFLTSSYLIVQQIITPYISILIFLMACNFLLIEFLSYTRWVQGRKE